MASWAASSLARELETGEHWLSPEELLAQLDIRPGMTVGEVGSGSGYYTLPISRAVGDAGEVFAIEWRSWMLETLEEALLGAGSPGNIRVIVRRAADTHLGNSSCDLLICADIWHELQQRAAVLDEADRILRPNGRLAILNWRPDALCPPGPPLEHRTSIRSTICTVEEKAWSLLKVADFPVHGYLIVFEKTDESVQS